MQPVSPRAGRIGRPPRLSREALLQAAHRVLEEEGPDRLTMRRLAREVSSTPMALYYYVQDKDEVLLLLLQEQAQRFPRPELPADPRERLLATAEALHDMFVGCPWIAEVLTPDDLMTVSALWVVEALIDSCIECGLSPEAAVYSYRVIWHYTVGRLVVPTVPEQPRPRTEQPGRARTATVPPPARSAPPVSGTPDSATENGENSHRQELEIILSGLLAGAGR
ncbi:TetR/AcrR family transcriptional regulator [Streptomyces sp. NBC_00893]|uniref:TetR/AcrR family transcriptional regulator n=1 Tax=Streptomyces sp. NBC_00893 TaxID=2975862 RepID=UPI002252DC3A|nr:TetR/AcrR family transcriptional regulator C-terminal domain-containing protein [Streptomyces sp. NBC_00893]MCX4849526.1 TetR/AcrR family transcriptional regulator [Streptomyces sp. NBC_00893]